MNRKIMAGVFIGGIVLLIACIMGVTQLFSRRQAESVEEKMFSEVESENISLANNGINELLTEVESEKQAQEIAQMYGITLKSVTDDLAVFETEEEPQDVIKRGQENGWKQLYPNTVYHAYE